MKTALVIMAYIGSLDLEKESSSWSRLDQVARLLWIILVHDALEAGFNRLYSLSEEIWKRILKVSLATESRKFICVAYAYQNWTIFRKGFTRPEN